MKTMKKLDNYMELISFSLTSSKISKFIQDGGDDGDQPEFSVHNFPVTKDPTLPHIIRSFPPLKLRSMETILFSHTIPLVQNASRFLIENLNESHEFTP